MARPGEAEVPNPEFFSILPTLGAMEHKLEAVELEALCSGKLQVTRDDVEKLLRERGALPPVPVVKGRAPAKARTGAVGIGAKAGALGVRKLMLQQQHTGTSVEQVPLSEPVDPLLDDVAMLDGNTIEIEWPQTRPGKGTRFRRRVGTVRHTPKQVRKNHENVYLVEFVRREGTPRTKRGARLRKTSWMAVSKRKYRVLSATRPKKTGKDKWTVEDTEALRVRMASRETHESIGTALGRTGPSIDNRVKVFNPAYAAFGGARRLNSGVTTAFVEKAMLTLPAYEGTATEVCAAIMSLAEAEGRPLDADLGPGQKTQRRWEQTVSKLLPQSELFVKLPERRHSSTGTKAAIVWRYAPPDMSAEKPRSLALVQRVKCQQPNVAGPKLSHRAKQVKMAGGDRRHGD